MENYRDEKVKRYEEFVESRLKPDLVKAIAERDKIFEQQKIFSDLKKNIQNLETNSVTKLTTLVNLGSEVYMQAEVYGLAVFSLHPLPSKHTIMELGVFLSGVKNDCNNLDKRRMNLLSCPDTRYICVDVGLGFHVEFTWSEALHYIAAREERLIKQIEEYTHLIASIKARIKLVCEGIRELLQIPAE